MCLRLIAETDARFVGDIVILLVIISASIYTIFGIISHYARILKQIGTLTHNTYKSTVDTRGLA